jgi:hypothetical protein
MTLYYVVIIKVHGIQAISPRYTFYVVNSTISNNNGDGINIFEANAAYYTSIFVIAHCTIENNAQIGISLYLIQGKWNI